MQTRDHKALALKLLGEANNDGLWRHRRAFLLGCVEPDYNLLTYVRGSFHYSAFRGHNAENAQVYVRRCIEELQYAGLHSSFSYFALGTLLHYVADTFTYPHNADFSGNLLEHTAYEKKLHQVFSQALSGYTHAGAARQTYAAENFLAFEHRQYCVGPHSTQTDCAFILEACTGVLDKLLCRAPAIVDHHEILEARNPYENSYHNGLV